MEGKNKEDKKDNRFIIFCTNSNYGYEIVKEREKFFAIYLVSFSKRDKFIMHRTSFRKAYRIAKLLKETFDLGYYTAKDIYSDNL